MYSYDTIHQVKYSNDGPVPIREIIKSLQGFEAVARELRPLMNSLVMAGAVESVEIYVKDIASGSLIEDFLIRLLFKDKDGFNAAADQLRERLGLDDDDQRMKAIIGALVMAALVYGITLSLPKDAPESSSNSITGNQNVVINFVAETLRIDSETVRRTIEQAVVDKKALAKGAVDVVQAAKLDEKASITINGNDAIAITPETIKQAPMHYEPPKPEKETTDYPRAFVQIRATDRDSDKQGWRCIVPGLSDARIKLVLDPAVDKDKLSLEKAVMADITVTSKYDEAKKRMTPIEVFLRQWEGVR